MKKTFLLLLTFLVLGSSSVYAQDNTKAIKKLIKSSSKALKKYKTDPTNLAKLEDAKATLDEAMKLAGADAMPEFWSAKGNISQALAEQDILGRNELMKQDVLNGEGNLAAAYMVKSGDAAVNAFEAYSKALELTEKKSKKGKIVAELEKNATFLNDIAAMLYSNNKDYGNAYKNFNALVSASKLVQANGGKPLLDTKEKIEDNTYYAAICAQLAKMDSEALVLYKELYDAGSKKIDVYDALFRANLETDEAAALKYLEEGRAIDPENTNLLFSEINFYLKKGQYDILEGKLQKAMEKEPNNASLRAVMGNVYNDFYKKETDPTKAAGHFAKAEGFYKEALEINAESFEALYSLGELNYNKAAALVTTYNDLPLSATQREVDDLKAQYLSAFDKALPYFLKADEVNPKDYNTILALKEIFAKKDDFTKSNEYKARLEAMK